MKFPVVLPLAAFGLLAGASPDTPHDEHDVERAVTGLTQQIQARAIQRVEEQASRLHARGLEATCTKEKLYFRKE